VKPDGCVRILPVALRSGLLCAVAALVCLTGCKNPGEGPPTKVALTAASDTTIRISWKIPVGALPDSYVLAFQETGQSTWQDFGTATDSAKDAYHNPRGKTGRYRVTSVFGGRSYSATQTPTSEPVHSAAMPVGELNSTSYPAYGWDRDSGTGSVFTMKYASNADNVDFYITDWTTGKGGQYYAASPDLAPNEPGGAGLVPAGAWRTAGLSLLPADQQSPLPAYNSGAYADNLLLRTDSTFAAVLCTDSVWVFDTTLVIDTTTEIDTTTLVDTFPIVERRYGLVLFGSPDTISGTVPVETRFQLIPNLRLIQH